MRDSTCVPSIARDDSQHHLTANEQKTYRTTGQEIAGQWFVARASRHKGPGWISRECACIREGVQRERAQEWKLTADQLYLTFRQLAIEIPARCGAKRMREERVRVKSEDQRSYSLYRSRVQSYVCLSEIRIRIDLVNYGNNISPRQYRSYARGPNSVGRSIRKQQPDSQVSFEHLTFIRLYGILMALFLLSILSICNIEH